MDRRQALKRVAVVSSVSVAGCSSVLGPGGTVLGKIEVLNSSFVANRIRLMVERDDDSLLDRTISLGGIDAGNGAPGTVIEPTWSETRGQYTVRALHYDESDERETGDWEYTFTREDYDTYYGDSHEDPGCIGAVVKIGSLADTPNAAIGIGPTYMENPCETPDSRQVPEFPGVRSDTSRGDVANPRGYVGLSGTPQLPAVSRRLDGKYQYLTGRGPVSPLRSRSN